MKLILYILLILTIQTGWCVSGINQDGSLNKKVVGEFYFDGDFDKVIDALEHFRKNNPDASDKDKIFMYKYLSVVYAARQETRDKGESYMYQLLKLVPTATLIDMYISDNIKSIFKNVKEEYQERLSYMNKADSTKQSEAEIGKSETHTAPEPVQPVKSSEKKSAKSKKWVWWTVGGVAIAAVVVTFIVVGMGEKDKVQVIP